jgi:hypothetical protein
METFSDKTIKKIELAFITVVIIAVVFFKTTYLSKEGEISVKNGKGVEVDVPYNILSSEISENYSKRDFKKILIKASQLANSSCKYEPTYEPLRFNVYGSDTTTVSISFSAENSFGVPDELFDYYDFVGTDYIGDEISIIEEIEVIEEIPVAD